MARPRRGREPNRRAGVASVYTRAMRSLALVVASLAVVAACSDDVGLPDARPAIDAAAPGQIALTWSLNHAGLPQTCASVGATGVAVDIVPVGSLFGEVDGWSCASGMGTTRALEPGRYDLRITVSGGGTLDGPIIRLGVEVRPGQVTTIEPIVFDVEPSGAVTFRITTPAGDNCAAAPAGAGITAMRVELRDAAGTCVPTTFAIAAGATLPAGSYASDCAGATAPCIAADQVITANEVPAGQRTLALVGLIGAAPCWTRTSQYAQRAGGLTTMLNPQELVLATGVPGCPMP